MHILIVNDTKIPAIKYGGIERVIWGLGKALTQMGHTVSYMVAPGSSCPFAKQMLVYDKTKDFDIQVPKDVDVIHLNWMPQGIRITKPYLVTLHGNIGHPCILDTNTVFISADHAHRHGGEVFVYNGLDWDAYPTSSVNNHLAYKYFHFLANASWKVKNVRGAIKITKAAGKRLEVLGGNRLNLNMGIRFTPDLHVRFRGQVDDVKKAAYLSKSQGLVFPVLWNEPFGLVIIESLYFGCPVFATPYGSLKELVVPEVGVVSESKSTLSKALQHAGDFDRKKCHEYARDKFNERVMAANYLGLYEKVLNGVPLHNKAVEVKAENLPKRKYLEMLP